MDKTTKNHFKIFIKEFKKYYHLLGLTRYYVDFNHQEVDGGDGCCETSVDGRCARITLSTEIDDVTDDLVRSVAKHEALELLMAEFWLLAQYRYIREDELEKERHAVIRALELII